MKMNRRQFMSMASALGAVTAAPALAATAGKAADSVERLLSTPGEAGILETVPFTPAPLSQHLGLLTPLMLVTDVRFECSGHGLLKQHVEAVSVEQEDARRTTCRVTLLGACLNLGDLFRLEASWPERELVSGVEMKLEAKDKHGTAIEPFRAEHFEVSTKRDYYPPLAWR